MKRESGNRKVEEWGIRAAGGKMKDDSSRRGIKLRRAKKGQRSEFAALKLQKSTA